MTSSWFGIWLALTAIVAVRVFGVSCLSLRAGAIIKELGHAVVWALPGAARMVRELLGPDLSWPRSRGRFRNPRRRLDVLAARRQQILDGIGFRVGGRLRRLKVCLDPGSYQRASFTAAVLV